MGKSMTPVIYKKRLVQRERKKSVKKYGKMANYRKGKRPQKTPTEICVNQIHAQRQRDKLRRRRREDSQGEGQMKMEQKLTLCCQKSKQL